MPKTESKYANQLRALGFEKLPPKFVKKVRKSLNRIMERSPHYEGLMPTFTPSDIMTYATDETGVSWLAFGRKDLSSIGFRNNIEWFANKPSEKKLN